MRALPVLIVLGAILAGDAAPGQQPRPSSSRGQRSVMVPPRTARNQPAPAAEPAAEGEETPAPAPLPPPRANAVPAPTTQGAIPEGAIIEGPIQQGPGQFYDEHGHVVDGGYFDEGYSEYADGTCGLDCPRCGGAGCRLMWFSAEYLMFWGRGMNTPPLVTTSPAGTAQAAAGVIGQPGTTVLYGGNGLLDGVRNGMAFSAGKWFDCCQQTGIEFDYFFLGQINEHFEATGNGQPILARPFFNAVTNLEDSELVSFPNVLSGTVSVDSNSFVQSAGVRLLWNVLQNYYCGDPNCGHYACGAACTRWDLLVGYRWYQLDEQLTIREDLTTLDQNPQVMFDITDDFRTRNNFHGGELGLKWQFQQNRWALDALGKVALGNNHEQVSIRGQTISTPVGGASDTGIGGLLAQTTNIGDYSRDRFAAIFEVGAKLKYQCSQNLWLTAGYTFIMWDGVVRPGGQIDRVVNPNLLPPPTLPLVGPARPAFTFNDETFWLHGLRLGGEFRW